MASALGFLFLCSILLFPCLLVARLIRRTTEGHDAPGRCGRGQAPDFPVSPAPRYERARPLLSPAERSFLGVLEQAVGPDLRAMAKVRLADLIQPSPRLPARERGAAFNRISRKHVDFVLCDPRTLAVVELDDRSHGRADRRERDAFVDGVLAEAGLPILHVPCRQGYSVVGIQGLVRQAVTDERRAA